MKSAVIILLTLVCCCQLSAQSIEKTYFRDQYQRKETRVEKAKFVKLNIQNPDSSNTIEFRRVKDDFLISTETYKGEVPYGLWRRYNLNGSLISELDYTFTLRYLPLPPDDAILINLNSGELLTDVQGDFQSTKTENDAFTQVLRKNIRYPRQAARMGIQGDVKLLLSVSEKGEIDYFAVLESANIYLDVEAIRVIKLLGKVKPATLNGKPVKIYAMTSVVFQLR